jgi:hypothetical protein
MAEPTAVDRAECNALLNPLDRHQGLPTRMRPEGDTQHDVRLMKEINLLYALVSIRL